MFLVKYWSDEMMSELPKNRLAAQREEWLLRVAYSVFTTMVTP